MHFSQSLNAKYTMYDIDHLAYFMSVLNKFLAIIILNDVQIVPITDRGRFGLYQDDLEYVCIWMVMWSKYYFVRILFS
jgi:hypothetical protein